MFKHAPRNAAIAFGLAAAALAGGAAPSFAFDPCDAADPPDYCYEQPPVNHTPSVSLKANGKSEVTVVRGEAVHFSGSASDIDQDTIDFAYDVNHDGSFDDFANMEAFDHAYSTLGTRVVRIRATDDENATSETSVKVNVVNRAPSVHIEGPTELLTGQTATYKAVTSDPDGDTVGLAWGEKTCNDIPNGEGSGPTKDITAHNNPEYAKVVCVVAYDGNSGGYAFDRLEIKVVNRKPVAALSFLPAKPVAGETVTFDSSASKDDDGEIKARAWDTNGDGKFDDGTGVTAQRAFATAGTYKAALKVVDDRGDESVKEVSVTVAAKPTDQKPVDEKPADQKPVDTTKPADTTTKPADTTTKPADQTTKPADQVQVLPDVKAGPAANASTLRAKLTRKGKVKTLKVKGAKGSIAVACKGKGCAFKTKSTTNANLKSLFRKALKQGATITVVTGDGTTTAKRTFTVKVGKAGKAKVAIA